MKPAFYSPLLIFATIVCTASNTTAQSYRRYVHQADSCFIIGEYDNSLTYYAQAFAIKSTAPRDLYNAACAASLGGAQHFGMALLKLSVDNGWTNLTHLESDADLRPLHSLQEWSLLVEDLRKKVEHIESMYDKQLQEELLTIYKADQGARREYSYLKRMNENAKADSLLKVIHHDDSVSIKKVTSILDERGWIGHDLVGEQASEAVFIAIYRADLQTQLKYISLLKDAVDRKVARPEQLAFLEDQIAVSSGEEQVYGSVIAYDHETGKTYIPAVKDPDHVDERREAIGLDPMSDYVRIYGLTWDPKHQSDVKSGK